MNELKKIAPKLSKMKKELPFNVPDHYFDDFSARLHSKLDADEVALPKQKNRMIRLLKPALGLAASFLLIFMLVYWPIKSFLPNHLAKNNAQTETKITEEDTYMAVIERLDETSFFGLLEEPAREESFNDEELMNYISSNMSNYDLYLETDN